MSGLSVLWRWLAGAAALAGLAQPASAACSLVADASARVQRAGTAQQARGLVLPECDGLYVLDGMVTACWPAASNKNLMCADFNTGQFVRRPSSWQLGSLAGLQRLMAIIKGDAGAAVGAVREGGIEQLLQPMWHPAPSELNAAQASWLELHEDADPPVLRYRLAMGALNERLTFGPLKWATTYQWRATGAAGEVATGYVRVLSERQARALRLELSNLLQASAQGGQASLVVQAQWLHERGHTQEARRLLQGLQP